MALKHHISYQGKPGRAVEYRRSDGLRPEGGSVDMNVGDLGGIKVIYRTVPWSGINDDTEFPGQLSIDAWAQLTYPTIQGKLKPQPPAPKVGLNHYGSLSMQSFDDAGNPLSLPMLYNFVYVDSSGLEEVGPQIAAIKAHDRGIVRVPLTDIRRYYRDHGLFVTRINVRDERGIWDPATLRRLGDGTLRPWKWEEVVRYLFALLPGSPFPFFDKEIAEDIKLRDSMPTNLIGRGDPAVDALEKLLDDSAVVPKMRPDCNYTLSKKASKIVPEGKVPTDPGVYQKYDRVHYETKSQYCTDRSPLWVVVGLPVVKRSTFLYVPVLEDEDGLLYQLKDVEKVISYKLADLNKQVYATGETQFGDCPPTIKEQDGADAADLQRKRIEMLKRMAYKVYVPAHAFENAFTISNGVKAITRGMLERRPFLPLVDAAWYASEIKNLGTKLPIGALTKSDQGEYAILPPVVRAHRVGQNWFRDIEEVEKYFEGFLTPRQDVEEELRAMLGYLQSLQAALIEGWKNEDVEKNDIFQDRTKSSEVADKFLVTIATIVQARIKDLDVSKTQDFDVALKAFKTLITQDRMLEVHLKQTWSEGQVKAELAQAISGVNDQLEAVAKLTVGAEEQLAILRSNFGKQQGIWLNMNLAWAVLDGGEGMIDKRTGILTSPEPLCRAKKNFWFQSKGVEVGADGAVVVTAGYEKYDSITGGLTCVLFAVGGSDEAPKPVYCGMNRPSALKGKLVRAPKLRLYENDLGYPVNGGSVVSDAASKVIGGMSVPLQADGFTYRLTGLVRAVLDGGCGSVQHVYDADKPGGTLTFVAVNAPWCRGPLGPVVVPRRAGDAELRERMEGGGDDSLRGLA